MSTEDNRWSLLTQVACAVGTIEVSAIERVRKDERLLERVGLAHETEIKSLEYTGELNDMVEKLDDDLTKEVEGLRGRK